MTPAVLLLGYALLMSTAGSWALRRARWPHRSPRLGVAAWQAASLSALTATGLAGFVLLLPGSPLSVVAARAAHACVAAFDAAYAAPGGSTAGALVGAVLVGAVARCGVLLGHDLWAGRRERGRQRRMLMLVARPAGALDALVLDHEAVAVYCLPGRGGKVVFTTAALSALGTRERRAVLAHELAHLRQHHHLVVAAARALRRGFPGVPLLRAAETEIAVLVEMVADDVSARRGGRHSVASALRALHTFSSPHQPVEGQATGVATGQTARSALVPRLHHLLSPAQPARAAVLGARSVVIAASLILPVVLAVTPAAAAAQTGLCPVPAAPQLLPHR
ncbi:MAG: M56 family metallopeptidase [Nocardioidaceae bacterium]|nr:M56 family metallopeptidase [Nocardioidaceae bacterium]